jgi:hypothetical protein
VCDGKHAQKAGEISKQIFTGSHRHAGFITIKGLRVAEKWGSNEKGYKQVMQLVLSKL